MFMRFILISLCMIIMNTSFAQEIGQSEISSVQKLRTLMMPGELIAGHEKYVHQCEKCHGDSDADQPKLCLNCHDKVALDVEQETGFHGNLKSNGELEECRVCHSDHKGADFNSVFLDREFFNHDFTDFQLVGTHQTVECSSCHKPDQKFSEAPQTCIACHKEQDVHEGKLGESCSDCHSAQQWQDIEFDHNTTEFMLKDAHAEVSCASCHPDRKFTEVGQECIDCHRPQDKHQGQFGQACANCHTQQAWDNTTFNHNTETDFALIGAHETASCQSCHADKPLTEPINSRCSNCHKNDDIHLNQMGPNCQQCHNSSAWDKAKFDHNKTNFKLTGSHQEATCSQCHQVHDLVIQQDTECKACHSGQDVHSGGLGADCSQCHNTEQWNKDIQFNHALTNFPLNGMHALEACDSCHQGGQFNDRDTQCVACHKIDDAHNDIYGNQCDTCHAASDWQATHFDHNTMTDFLLDGAHLDTECQQCHSDTKANETPTDCFSCHMDDDPHRRSFGRDCERCHNTSNFSEIKIRR